MLLAAAMVATDHLSGTASTTGALTMKCDTLPFPLLVCLVSNSVVAESIAAKLPCNCLPLPLLALLLPLQGSLQSRVE